MSSAPLLASQLDRIEDALEELEFGGIPDAIGSATDERTVAVATHLDAYRQILVLSRDALPMQDAPAGVLDAVLAEARAVAGVPAVAPATLGSRELGWWDKFRANFWVPALGFAGAAALLLVVLRPTDDVASEAKIARTGEVANAAKTDAEPSPDAAASPAASPSDDALDGRLADASRLIGGSVGTRGAQGVPRGEGLLEAEDESTEVTAAKLDDARSEDPRSSARPGDVDDDDDDDVGEDLKGRSDDAPGEMPSPLEKKPRSAGTSKLPASPAKKNKKSKKSEPPGKQVPQAPRPTPTKSSNGAGGGDSGGVESEKREAGLAKLGERGEARRRSGNCGLARLDFTKARGASDASTRAKALAGLGLCELSAGDEAAANALFASARAADRTVAAFIEQQRAKIEAGSPQSRD